MGERTGPTVDHGAEPCLLLTSAASETAFALARTLRARWGDEIVVLGADVAPAHLVAAAQFLDGYTIVPAPGHPERVPVLLDVVADHEVELIVTLDDADTAPLAELDDLRGAALVIDDAALARQTVDRLAIADLVDSMAVTRDDLCSPKTTTLERATWTRHGIVVKPRFGRNDAPIRFVTELDEFEALLDLHDRWPGRVPLVAQSMCTPPEITVDALRHRDGRFRAVCRERLGTLGGQCTRARVFDHPELSELAERLLAGLRVSGLVTLQVMDGPAGQWMVTDLRLHATSGTALTVAAGIDLFSAFVADQLDLPADPTWTAALPEDRYVVRTFTEWVSPGPG